MIDEQHLREGLQRLLRDTETAIRERISDEPSIESHLRERHAAAVQAGRTAGSASGYNSFADEAITQSGVHWLLGCVFVRFLEDNGWLDERNKVVAWLAGPGERLAIAKGERTRFLRPDPTLTDRDYLLYVFREVTKLPGMAGLFDPRHNPLFQLAPTAQGAAKIVEFFQKVDPDTGSLIRDFTDPDHQTRFLGDLYQNLSESARKLYALCQTPAFVIDFILDRTLTPAIDTFGLGHVRLIDPSCGSGHFLLAAFFRLFRCWQHKEPGANPPALVQRALGAVYGVDLNPFAAEISRFRLLIAALESSSIDRLRDAPNFCFNIAAGDSLLHGSRITGGGINRGLFEDRLQHYYEAEDAEELKRILGQSYHVVVGNPPYINVNDSVLRDAYRSRFSTCHRQFQLSVPFTERFFDLTLAPTNTESGYMGMIVSNAFMTRSFGQLLIENYLVHKDLTHVIDCSGLNLPGHGTPTTILLARNREPLPNSFVRSILGIVGILSSSENLETSPVWREILGHIDDPGFVGERVSVSNYPRSMFATHPWPTGGGGAAELGKKMSEICTASLENVCDAIGRTVVLGEEDAWLMGDSLRRRESYAGLTRPLISGEDVRDWSVEPRELVLYAYRGLGGPVLDALPVHALRRLWPNRSLLEKRSVFRRTMAQMGKKWYEVLEHYVARFQPSFSIACAEIATHNHFAFDEGGKLFNQTAPVIKLAADASRDRYLELLGLLNSSAGCFWLRQVAHDKGGGGVGGGLSSEPWERRKCFTVTVISSFPVPENKPLSLASRIQATLERRTAVMPPSLCQTGLPSKDLLNGASEQAAGLLAQLISLQEELDWQCYRLYGIIDEDVTLPVDEVPPLKLGERSFEIVLARSEDETAWFERHRSTPIKELPAHWPEAYRKLVERRIAMIGTNRDIALIERPEFKRRWNLPPWEEAARNALRNWLLEGIEASTLWHETTLVSCSQLRDALARDADWISVATVYSGTQVEHLDELVRQLLVSEAVPFLPVLRYSETGLRKRREWEEVWDLQRKEDTGEHVQIPGPPKYRNNDFLKSDYWRLRGALDVPKERFVLYPGFERDADRTPVFGWAGWSHLDQAKALAGYCQRMRTEEGWEPERLKPVLAGLLDLKPWLLQWHNELDPETGVKLGEYFVQFAESQCQELGFSPEEVRAWQPAATTSSRARARRTNARRPQ